MDLSTWALPQLSKLLPLDDESLKQIIAYTESLPNREAADHLQNLLGDSPQALEFITSFNTRRKPKAGAASSQAQSSNDLSQVPKAKPRKKQPALGKLPPQRQPDNYGNVSGAYVKKDEEDYMAGSSRSKAAKPHVFGLTEKPDAVQKPTIVPLSGTGTPTSRGVSPSPPVSKLPPSAAGQLISETKSRNSSPKPKAKVSVAGGTPMHGASTALNDLESAIRALEIQTNPSLASQDNTKRQCNCMATRHPLLEAAPNCINCGKIICVKEGIGPCTFCNTPLLSSQDIQSMVRVLREERGKEKMVANNASQKRADVSLAPRPFSTPRATTPVSSNPASDVESENEKLAKAKQHRDKLLAFQAQNAKRTQVHDEAADFETTSAGLSMWASPQERAMQLKRQQKALREQEWNARPEYEKRNVVASIDLSKGKLVRRMAAAKRPTTPESEDEPTEPAKGPTTYDHGAISSGSGAFSKNPLLGGLIRPTIKVEGSKGKEKDAERKQTWRRVQDDNDDNEQWILDGGVYGARAENVSLEMDGLK
ncbi:zf-C2HC5-domain-containing protein [Cucurbitaria berberidis CBS 394.84]|uniref:Zf-C2HC5-domain-containing protein n=1 Tax=Cucurbitaria berberidis CBS 394.84 TaxID=1168544 RepID=A0A9P4LFI3_9PLEO|nr:zf-C2HC5-domain-containing protein [Cucurbitaria berberidis CBS 394.84]KAF1852109.1 zf-C2HC5-domain-containing protein [Cucurbitaria berberidis CBS 394.84]